MNDKKIKDIEKELKELNKLLSRSIIKQEKLKQALDLIDELIENYEINLDMYMTSDQPDNYFVTKQTIEDLEKIKKILEAQSDILYRKIKMNIEKRFIVNINRCVRCS